MFIKMLRPDQVTIVRGQEQEGTYIGRRHADGKLYDLQANTLLVRGRRELVYLVRGEAAPEPPAGLPS